MRIAFIINSNSSTARKAYHEIRRHLRHKHEAYYTTAIGSANEIASTCLKEDYTHLAVLGGDGTLNEVFNALMNSGKPADELPILCIHPCGTGNDFVRNLQINNKAEDFLRRLDSGEVRYSDGGHASYTNTKRQAEQRYFLNAMDAGLGGLIAQRVNEYRRGRLAFLAYQMSIIRTLPFYRKQNVTVKTLSEIYEGPALSVVAANGKWFGNGLGIAPEAEILSGYLECVILARVNFWDYILNIPAIIRCNKIKHTEVHYTQVREIIIEGENNPIEMDGEFVGTSPVHIRVIPRAVRLLVG